MPIAVIDEAPSKAVEPISSLRLFGSSAKPSRARLGQGWLVAAWLHAENRPVKGPNPSATTITSSVAVTFTR